MICLVTVTTDCEEMYRAKCIVQSLEKSRFGSISMSCAKAPVIMKYGDAIWQKDGNAPDKWRTSSISWLSV
jgi:hypothetical protein